MFCTVLSASILGVESVPVHVEADVGDGLPSFSMVGFLSTQVKEAQERVRTALKNSGIRMLPKRITVNLSPADLRKSGTAFDLPIAVAIAAGYGEVRKEDLEGLMLIGELSLNGGVLPVCGVFLLIQAALQMGCHTCIVPKENLQEAAMVEGIRVFGVESLEQTIRCLKGEETAFSAKREIQINRQRQIQEEDFADINGQEGAKRAAEVAAAGFHNLLFAGAPGSGKTMIAKRIPTILPLIRWEEQIELTKIYSMMGLLPAGNPMFLTRPFRTPHHTITAKAMVGGGRIPVPGEITLAHRGVLFLDELAEFSRETLEVLRQPMEEKQITISREGRAYDFPADFMLVAATNLCPCGHFPDVERCVCTNAEVMRYLGKISGPFLERIDLSIEVSAIGFDEMEKIKQKETSAQIRERVEMARDIQKERAQGQSFFRNSQMTETEMIRFCYLGKEEKDMMKEAFEKLDLSARGYYRTLKVARTIADLEASDTISCAHLAEALCYRNVRKKYWAGR